MDSIKDQQREWYMNREKLFLAVDCIIFGFDEGTLKLLLFKRKVEPLKDEWSLIGSFVRTDETVLEAANRILKDITGLEDVFMKELKTYSEIDRDPGARCVSIAQYALIRIDDYDKELVSNHGAFWFPLYDMPSLVLDHNQMVKDALGKLRDTARHFPLGFELLPKEFTVPQIQLLYEQIFQMELDSRNFRKKILSFNFLKNTMKKDKSTSKKGAYLYQFDEVEYKKLSEDGFSVPLLKNVLS